MTSARHRQVVEHPTRRRLTRLVVPASAAVLVTAGVVAAAVGAGGDASSATGPSRVAEKPLTADLGAAVSRADGAPGDTSTTSPYLAERTRAVSRSARRVTLQEKPEVKDREFMTADLNLWPAPREKGKPLAVLSEGGTVALTGVTSRGFAQILRGGQLRWVNDTYLSDEKPVDPATSESGGGSSGTAVASTGGLSSAPCADGSGTESGLTSSAVRLFRAACAAFPALSSYGGYDGHGEHSSGKAIDFMVTDPSLGQALADWARAHAPALDLYDILWQQHIWTPVRASEGWRSMPDRGSATANHFDHVHIAVN